jgi:hypothetical protein
LLTSTDKDGIRISGCQPQRSPSISRGFDKFNNSITKTVKSKKSRGRQHSDEPRPNKIIRSINQGEKDE